MPFSKKRLESLAPVRSQRRGGHAKSRPDVRLKKEPFRMAQRQESRQPGSGFCERGIFKVMAFPPWRSPAQFACCNRSFLSLLSDKRFPSFRGGNSAKGSALAS